MDYEEAEKHFTKRSPFRRRVDGHKNTWLHRGEEPRGPISLRLFQTDIITYFADGSLEININGYITPTTMERFRSYLPNPYRLFTERLPCGGYIAYLRTPGGGGHRPCKNRQLTATLEKDLGAMSDRDAGLVRRQVWEYAKEYVQRLTSVGMTPPNKAGDCRRCVRAIAGFENEPEAHYLKHLDQGSMPPSLILAALQRYKPQLLAATLRLFEPNRGLVRKPRTMQAALERAEAALMGVIAPRHDLRHLRKKRREVLDLFLLENLGFERISQREGLKQGMNDGQSTKELMGW